MIFRGDRIQLAGAIALIPLSVCFVALRCALSPDVPLIRQSADAPWIMAPSPVSAELQQWGREDVPVARFTRGFVSDEPAAQTVLRVRALRSYRAWLNGEPIPGARGDGESWRAEARIDLGPLLRPGWNELRFEVSNARGPALLSVRVDGLPDPLHSDASWSVELAGRRFEHALVADDTRRHALTPSLETPRSALVRRVVVVLLLFGAGALGFAAASRWGSPGALERLPALTLAAAALAWLWLFFEKFVHLPLQLGFDARHHLHYVDLIARRGALPLATDGWSTFHPPLFHLASLAMRWLGGAVGAPGAPSVSLKWIPFLSGLGVVFAGHALARRLFPSDPLARAFAVLFAAVLPINLYTAAYFSNESVHTLLSSLGVLVTVDMLLADRATLRQAAGMGALLGLAALTKYTALLLLPVALFFVVCKLLLVERVPARRGLALIGAVGGLFLLIAGWYYLRNWLRFGAPLVPNWDLPGPELVWWQQPGFHTLAYYTSFGEALVRPYLSGFHSFWDSVYSTFWGDGFVAGRLTVETRHTFWNYDFMSIGYLAALPATLLLVVGGARSVAIALTDPNPRLRAAFSFLATASWTVGLAFFYLTLSLAFFAQAKATYVLVLITPLAAWFALGAGACDSALAGGGWRWALRCGFYGWLAVFAGTLLLGFAA